MRKWQKYRILSKQLEELKIKRQDAKLTLMRHQDEIRRVRADLKSFDEEEVGIKKQLADYIK